MMSMSFLKKHDDDSNSQSASQSDFKLLEGASEEISEDFNMQGSHSQMSFNLDQIVIGNPTNGKINKDEKNPYELLEKPKKAVNFEALGKSANNMNKSSIDFANFEGRGLLKYNEEDD